MSLQQLLNNDCNEPSFNELSLNDASFESFFIKNFVLMCAYCQFKFGLDLDLAKEVVHTQFIKLWETLKSNHSDLPVKPYLYKLIANSCLDMIRHQKVVNNYEKELLGGKSKINSEPGYTAVEYKQLESNINKAIDALPGKMKKIFILSRQEGLKYSEIAYHLNVSVKTVETQISRALARLRQTFSEYF